MDFIFYLSLFFIYYFFLQLVGVLIFLIINKFKISSIGDWIIDTHVNLVIIFIIYIFMV